MTMRELDSLTKPFWTGWNQVGSGLRRLAKDATDSHGANCGRNVEAASGSPRTPDRGLMDCRWYHPTPSREGLRG